MSSPPPLEGVDLLEVLSQPPSKESLELAERVEQWKARFVESRAQTANRLLSSNSTLPVTINKIEFVKDESGLRKSFLDGLYKPIYKANSDGEGTFSEAVHNVGQLTSKLKKLEIFHENVYAWIGRPDPTDASTTPTDIDIYISAKKRGRIKAQTGTDIGNVEGSAYGFLQLRNIFGGAESLTLNASTGTRTKSAYQATFDTPVFADPDKRVSVDVLSSSTSKPWASHEEALKGGSVKYSWEAGPDTKHQICYNGVWRQITSLASNASPTVRRDAGDSVKSSITHTWIKDRRNHPFLPSTGYLLKSVSEIAGWGPLQGDVAFWKSEIEAAGSVPVPLPGLKGDSGISMTGAFRTGLLYPLPIGFGSMSGPSRINDRFTLGGPTDVRGFKMAGLGPHDGVDAVGGDIYAAASTSLLFPLPKVGKESPLRLQIFANAGRLMTLKDSKGKAAPEDAKSTQKDFYSSVAQLGHGLPSLSAGIGLVYAHPVARFELNLALPLVVRKGEETRKGLQFGVGISFF